MKAKMSKIFSVLVISLLMIIPVYASVPEEPHDANAMWIEPSTKDLTDGTVEVGHKFNVTVWANITGSSCASWEFKIAYNKNYLNVTRCEYTGNMKSEFFANITTIPLVVSIGLPVNSTHNYVLHAESWGMIGPFRNPGYGSLAWIEFEVVAIPDGIQTFLLDQCLFYDDETYLQDNLGQKIPLDCSNAIVIIPEFLQFAFFALLMSLTLVTCVLSVKVRNSKNHC